MSHNIYNEPFSEEQRAILIATHANAIRNLEIELGSVAPTLAGGRLRNETIIEYVMRTRKVQDDLIQKIQFLSFIRTKLEAKDVPTEEEPNV